MPKGQAAMIRAYRPADLEATVLLLQRSVREIAGRDHSPAQGSCWAPEPPPIKAWAHRLETGQVLVSERSGVLVGFARMDDAGCLDLLYVHPQTQRQEVARALVDRLISSAGIRGIRHRRLLNADSDRSEKDI